MVSDLQLAQIYLLLVEWSEATEDLDSTSFFSLLLFGLLWKLRQKGLGLREKSLLTWRAYAISSIDSKLK